MPTPLAISANNAIDIQGHSYRLNLYDCICVVYDATAATLKLSFSGAVGLEAYHANTQLEICYEGVNHFESSAAFNPNRVRKLSEIGFKNPDDQDLDWLLSHVYANPNDHTVYRFEGNEFVRVHAQSSFSEVIPDSDA